MIFLAQSDTTAGFASTDSVELNLIKGREADQKLISLISRLAQIEARVAKTHRNLVRKATKTTFIFANGKSFRVVPDDILVRRFGKLYSTSANQTGKKFDENWAKNASDAWLISGSGFSEKPPSRLIKLGKTKLKKLR